MVDVGMSPELREAVRAEVAADHAVAAALNGSQEQLDAVAAHMKAQDARDRVDQRPPYRGRT